MKNILGGNPELMTISQQWGENLKMVRMPEEQVVLLNDYCLFDSLIVWWWSTWSDQEDARRAGGLWLIINYYLYLNLIINHRMPEEQVVLLISVDWQGWSPRWRWFQWFQCVWSGAAGDRRHWRVRGGEVSPAKPGGCSSLSIFVLPLKRMFICMMNVANMRTCA